MANYLKIGTSGLLTEEATVASGGAGNANKVPNLDANGQLAESMMPSGIGADTVVLATSENLSANDLVNIYNASGTMTARKADRIATSVFPNPTSPLRSRSMICPEARSRTIDWIALT